MNKKSATRKISVQVTAQTAYNLERLAEISKVGTKGRVIDKLVREKMLSIRATDQKYERNNKQ
ncbi:MAG: hypothetical protein OSJ54_06280 [Oscillospiraceae bacterium]|nr:hypothetical protein [Oscillospiraceae bacterium]